MTHRIRATAPYPAETLALKMQAMENPWQVMGHVDIAKRRVNSLKGLQSKRNEFCPPGAPRSIFHYDDAVLHDFVIKEQLSNGGPSNHHLLDLAMGQEHVGLALSTHVKSLADAGSVLKSCMKLA